MAVSSTKKKTSKKPKELYKGFDSDCESADKEYKEMEQQQSTACAPDFTPDDLRKQWGLGQGTEGAYKETLSDSMLNAGSKFKALFDAISEPTTTVEKPVWKKEEFEHYLLEDTVYMLNTVGICFLTGPAGTGKSTLAKSACKKIFNLKDDPIISGKYAQISFSPDTTSGEMIGRTDVNGVFHESEVVRVFRDGGLILFDEIDDADSSMLIKINTALANGYLATPNGMVLRNEKTYIVCAANTFGTGPDAMYVGRTRLDAATLDRFCLATLYVDYDTHLEDSIADQLGDDDHYWLTGYVEKIRGAIKRGKLRRTCSTRFVINAVKHMIAGRKRQWIIDNYLQGWAASERAKLKEMEEETVYG